MRFGECGICDQGENSGDVCRCDELVDSGNSDLLSSLSPVEIFELGWILRGCLEGSTHDGRDVVRNLLSDPVLANYTDAIGGNWIVSPMEAVGKVKQAIRADLSR